MSDAIEHRTTSVVVEAEVLADRHILLQLQIGSSYVADGPTLQFETWYCIEWYYKVANTGGVVQIKVDGALVINYSGDTQATTNTNIRTIRWGASSGLYAPTCYLDDILINDSEWPGRGGIHALVPTGAGTYSEWTPSAGANWENVDDVPPDDDTSYIYSTTLDARDTYQMSNLTATGQIRAVQAVVRAKAVEAGSTSVAPLLRIGGVDYQLSDIPIDTAYRSVTALRETSPATGSAWTVTELNGLEAGVVCR